MDGMLVRHHNVTTGGPGDARVTNTIRLPQPTSVIAEIHVASIANYGPKVDTFAVFTGCTTNGADGLPPVETFGAPFASVLVRNGLLTIDYDIEISNCSANFIINVFFWPGVIRN